MIKVKTIKKMLGMIDTEDEECIRTGYIFTITNPEGKDIMKMDLAEIYFCNAVTNIPCVFSGFGYCPMDFDKPEIIDLTKKELENDKK